MKKYRGFNLIELLVAIAISAAVITAITSSYGSLLSGYTFNNGKTQLYQSMRLSMNLIKRDLQNAGTFGSFSLHNARNNSARTSYLNGNGIVCTSNYCVYNAQTGTLGVGVYGSSAGNMAPLVQSTSSEILRMQFGGNKTAYYSGRTNGCGGGTVSVFNFNVPAGNATTASSYVLASSNRAYLINLPGASSNDSIALTNCTQFPAITTSGTVMTVPDQASMVLVPLITRYYFVKTINSKQGLYVVTFDGTNATGPTLVSSLITNLSVKYITETSATNNFNHVSANNTYQICAVSSMVTSGTTGNCVWNRVIGVIVTLTGQVNSGAGGTISQTLTDSIGWSW